MKEDKHTRRRLRMVRNQIEGRGIHEERVVEAFRTVPRHRFVPDDSVHRAYEDRPQAIGHGQTISQPYMVALMTALLDLQPADRVLEIGTGSGYQAAILSLLAGTVYSVERCGPLAESARQRLAAMGHTNVAVIEGDGSRGWPAKAPYDAIVVTAGSPSLPESLESQLAVGGRLVCPVGDRESQRLIRVVRTADGIRREKGIGCVFVPLIGEEGWPRQA